MRLIRLRLKNIASLKGEHLIDFAAIQDQGPLFAITGDTGSGKSSVLNSIGLALYGQIYKKNVNQLDVVTLGEKEGSIELIFQVKGQYYLSDWRARVRKQNGELYATPQTPSRNLYSISSPDFSAEKKISSTSITDLLNLDFDQFCKCIILNQGEFARFITSSFTERKDILEKLYPGELLESMGRILRLELENLQNEKNTLEIKLGELAGSHLLGETLALKKKELEDELQKHSSLKKYIDKVDYHFTSLSSYFEKHKENEKKKDLLKAELAKETTSYNYFLKNGEELLAQYQQAQEDQKRELPKLQSALKKEEALKHSEESLGSVRNKINNVLEKKSDCDKKLVASSKLNAEKETEILKLQGQFTLPLSKLKTSRVAAQELLDLFSEKELLMQEIKGKNERLSNLTPEINETTLVIQEMNEELKVLPLDLDLKAKLLETERIFLAERVQNKERALIQVDELKKTISSIEGELKSLREKVEALGQETVRIKEELIPIETTLKLQEVLSATALCLDHVLSSNKSECPVCTTSLSRSDWLGLKDKLDQTDLTTLRLRFQEATKKLLRDEQHIQHLCETIKTKDLNRKNKVDVLSNLTPIANEKLPNMQDLELELNKIKELIWKSDALKENLQKKTTERSKLIEKTTEIKNELEKLEGLQKIKDDKLHKLQLSLLEILPDLDRQRLRDLKNEIKGLALYIEKETELVRIIQDETYLNEENRKNQDELILLQNEEKVLLAKISDLKAELQSVTHNKTAGLLIDELNKRALKATEDWNRQIETQKKQEFILKNLQGRLIQLDELSKDFDLHFRAELQAIQGLNFQQTLASREETLKLRGTLQKLQLTFDLPQEVFLSLRTAITIEKDHYHQLSNDCQMELASTSARLSDWEKTQDKVKLFELQLKELTEKFSRKTRLYEILGKDELRTFVLSLVEENLITETNLELQKLCQGRYQIVHQTRTLRLVPEFFIVDKFRDGIPRKISTLSGGETFMVSLAMALGLAEMTRGMAEIDSLFIDEGFGTLDQDSLEDVMDMLKQIQNRGLTVGIISHVKALTDSLPVNLVLSKKQDGTSTTSVVYN